KEEQKPQSIVINNSRNIADGSEAYGVDISGDIHVHVGSESNDAEQGEANQSQGAGWQSLPLRWSAESVRLFRKKHEVPYVQDKKGRKDIGTEAHAAWLVLSRPRAGVRFKSSLHFKDTLCMGRDPGADVTCIPEEHVDPHSRSSYISRRHLTLRVSDEVCTLEDQSTNGTWVDKEMIHCQAVQLRSNQVINLGGLLYFKYEEFRDLASMKSRLWEWQLSRHSMNTPQVSLTTVKQEIKSLPISAVRLKRLGGEALSCQYLLVIRELEIGSDKANALFLDDESIAAQHAKLLLQDNRLFLLDLGSKTGTRLNGELLDPHRAIGLGQGDRIQLGRLEGFIHFVGPFVQ
ncbi:MAG: FHA domain-containing protein, partial [Desulfohalobiaceae bacterium]